MAAKVGGQNLADAVSSGEPADQRGITQLRMLSIETHSVGQFTELVAFPQHTRYSRQHASITGQLLPSSAEKMMAHVGDRASRPA